MKDSNFTFLQTTYPDLFTLGELAEKLISIDPNSSLTKLWGIERSGFFNGREKWAKGFENQRV